jgi:hypothetical protein
MSKMFQIGSSLRRATLWEGGTRRNPGLDGLSEVDRVPVRVLDVRHALSPRHVVQRAEHPAAQDLDVIEQARQAG